MKTVIKYYCDQCDHELIENELEIFTESKISKKLTEYVPKGSPLSYRPNIIYETTEGNDCDVVTYDHEELYLRYKCPNCGAVYSPNSFIK